MMHKLKSSGKKLETVVPASLQNLVGMSFIGVDFFVQITVIFVFLVAK